MAVAPPAGADGDDARGENTSRMAGGLQEFGGPVHGTADGLTFRKEGQDLALEPSRAA
jgi:hypothetical protein